MVVVGCALVCLFVCSLARSAGEEGREVLVCWVGCVFVRRGVNSADTAEQSRVEPRYNHRKM